MSTLSDLKFVSVSVVDASTNKNEDLSWERKRPGTQILKVEISTQTSLMEIAQRRELNVYVQVRMCPLTTGAELNNWGTVFFHEYLVSGLSVTHIRETAEARYPGPPYIYHIYFDYASPEWQNVYAGKPPHRAYDLAADPQDVCVHILGGGMWGLSGLETNTVVVPKEAIRAALQPVTK